MVVSATMIIRRSLLMVLLAIVAIGSLTLAYAPNPTPPTIGTPIASPSSPKSSDTVTVAVNVTSLRSTIKNVTIIYTTDNWKSVNRTIVAIYNATSTTARGQIPPLTSGGHVEYYVVAFDINGNSSVNNNNGSYFAYDVTAPTSITSVSTIAYILVGAAIAVALATFAFMLIRSSQGRAKRNPPDHDEDWNRSP